MKNTKKHRNKKQRKTKKNIDSTSLIPQPASFKNIERRRRHLPYPPTRLLQKHRKNIIERKIRVRQAGLAKQRWQSKVGRTGLPKQGWQSKVGKAAFFFVFFFLGVEMSSGKAAQIERVRGVQPFFSAQVLLRCVFFFSVFFFPTFFSFSAFFFFFFLCFSLFLCFFFSFFVCVCVCVCVFCVCVCVCAFFFLFFV